MSLRRRYREALAFEQAPATTRPAPQRAAAPPAPPRPPEPEGPGWMAEQQANLLLYLGAFLIVIAALIFVGYSEQEITDAIRMAMLVLGTLLFLAAGLICMRYPRVQQAGVVFFAVGALMVPLNFVGAYAFFLSDEDIDPTGLWLAGSLTSALFYVAVSMLGLGRWYPVPGIVALHSALAAVLVLAEAPAEAYPGSFIALALLVSTPSLLPLGRVSEVFADYGFWAAHLVVLASLAATLGILGATTGEGEERLYTDLSTRSYLPPTIAIAALFYWVHALRLRRDDAEAEPFLTAAALALSAATAVTIVYALDVGHQWYGPAVAIVGWLMAAGSDRFGPRWFGQRHLGWMALGSITVSWLLFEGIYAGFPRFGAGVHFSAAIFYLGAARLVETDVDLLSFGTAKDQEGLSLPLPVAFIYAAGLTLGIGYYHLLASLPAAETAGASDLSMAFFGLSLAIAGAAATMRFWWPKARLHVYATAIGMSGFVLLASADAAGQVTLLLAVYAGVALALALWEREPLALVLPAVYGFFAILAAWRYYEPDDAFLPLVFSTAGYALFAGYLALREKRETMQYAQVIQLTAFAYVAAAPVVGWARLAILADPEGFVGTESFEETVLYQTSATALLLLGLLVLAHSWLTQRVAFAVGASALLMVALLLYIGSFRPENVQAYSAPLGVYLLVGGILATRLRDLPDDLQSLVGPLQALGAAVLMGPSLSQAWDEDGALYALLLLVEGLILLGLALVQRWIWLLSTATGFIVLVALRYLFDAAQALPNWLTVLLAGLLLLAGGLAILLSREKWTDWQRRARLWWEGEPLVPKTRDP